MDSPIGWLVKIAPHSAAAWQTLGGDAYKGRTNVETSNSVYHFLDGVFLSRATKPHGAIEMARAPGVRLVGFLTDEGGYWALSARWRRGACAVLWMSKAFDARAFLVTSATLGCEHEAPQGQRASASRIRRRTASRTAFLHRSSPSSMTRIHPGGSDRDPSRR
jgi:hypothetical protein